MWINNTSWKLTTKELTSSIMIEAKKWKISTLSKIISSSNEELPPETVKGLLASKEGTTALIKAYKWNEDKVVFLLDTIDNIDDREFFIETMLFELASIIKQSESTSWTKKIDSIKSTIESIYTFLISLLSSSSNEKILEIIDLLWEEILFALLSETTIGIKEDLELDEDNIYLDDDSSFDIRMTALDKMDSWMTIWFNEIEISWKYSTEVWFLLETLFENDETLYSKILEEKVLWQDNYKPYTISSEELNLKESDPEKDTVYMLIKAMVEKYEEKYKDKKFKMNSKDIGFLIEDKSQKWVKSSEIKNEVWATAQEIEKIVKEEEGIFEDF